MDVDENIIEYMTSFVYRNICRGLFSRHEILFIFNVCLNIFRNKGDVSNTQYFTLLRAFEAGDTTAFDAALAAAA